MMLMKGDLVKVQQSSRLQAQNEESWRLKVLKNPEVAIVLKQGSEKTVILLDNSVYQVDTKDLRLYEVSGVC